MKRYYFDTDMRGDPKPVECAEGGLVYFEEANARIAELTAEVALIREALKLGLEYWADRQQRYKNRSPVWVEKARNALKEGM